MLHPLGESGVVRRPYSATHTRLLTHAGVADSDIEVALAPFQAVWPAQHARGA